MVAQATAVTRCRRTQDKITRMRAGGVVPGQGGLSYSPARGQQAYSPGRYPRHQYTQHSHKIVSNLFIIIVIFVVCFTHFPLLDFFVAHRYCINDVIASVFTFSNNELPIDASMETYNV